MYDFDDFFPFEPVVAEAYFKCSVDGQRYPESEMVFDTAGVNHIHKDNIDLYLLSFERDMDKGEFEALKLNLKNQVK